MIEIDAEKTFFEPYHIERGKNQNGYGRKISSKYQILYHGKKYRLYITCWSNCASYWILVNGVRMFVNELSVKA